MRPSIPSRCSSAALSPDELATAARVGVAAGYDEVNLNVGCPSDRVQAGCFGARLMLERERVAECVRAMRAAVDVPVTVKTRLGVDDHDSYEFVRDFVGEVAAAGLCDVHRARAQGVAQRLEPEREPRDPAARLRSSASFEARVPGADDRDQRRVRHARGQRFAARARRRRHDRPRGVSKTRGCSRASTSACSAGRAVVESEVLAAFERYVARELDAGTPLRTMTRHLLGMQSGRAGGRRWRRALSELTDGRRGLEGLRALVGAYSIDAALSSA